MLIQILYCFFLSFFCLFFFISFYFTYWWNVIFANKFILHPFKIYFRVIECKGPTNTRVYSVAVYFQGNRLAVGSGHRYVIKSIFIFNLVIDNVKFNFKSQFYYNFDELVQLNIFYGSASFGLILPSSVFSSKCSFFILIKN